MGTSVRMNTSDWHADDADRSISDRLEALGADAPGESVTLGWILDQLHERAFGLFLLILALPCCIPFLYGIPQIVSLPLVFVSAQTGQPVHNLDLGDPVYISPVIAGNTIFVFTDKARLVALR